MYECCDNCKHARDKFEEINTNYALFYCDANEKINMWNMINHRCDKYESNLHDHSTAPRES